MRGVKAAVLTAALCCAPFLYGQTTNLTLEQATQVALDHNQTIIQADANVGAAQAGVTAAYGGYLPTLSASGSWGRDQVDQGARNVVFGGLSLPIAASRSTTTNISTSLSASMTLFDGFNRQGQVGQATPAPSPPSRPPPAHASRSSTRRRPRT